MASPQSAYRNSGAAHSENFSRSSPATFIGLIEASELPPNLARTFKSLIVASEGGPDFWASTENVSIEASFCYRTAQRHLDELERRRLIRIKHQANVRVPGYGFRHTATYEKHPEAKKHLAPRLSCRDWKKWKKNNPEAARPKPERRIYTVDRLEQRAEALTTPSGSPSVVSPRPVKSSSSSSKPASRPLRSGERKILGSLFQEALDQMQQFPPESEALQQLAKNLRELQLSKDARKEKLNWRGFTEDAIRSQCPHLAPKTIAEAIDAVSQELRGHGLADDEVPVYLFDRSIRIVPRTRREAVVRICRRTNMSIETAIAALEEAGHEFESEDTEQSP